VPVLFLGPRSVLQVDGALPPALRPGVDAYLGRPLDAAGLVEAVAGLLPAADNAAPGQARTLRAGPLSLEPVGRFLRWMGPDGQGRLVRLTPIECRLFREFMDKPNLALTTEELLVRVWGFYPGTGGAEVLRAHVRNLRRKLRRLHEGAELLVTVPWVGYRLSVTDSP
jgi:DNA-binding response OmpR family regulator